MNILFYTGSFNKGGAERVIANLANSFIKDNNVKIVVSKLSEVGYKLDKKIELESMNPKNKINFILKNIEILKNLKKTIKEYKPNIVISFMNEPNIRTLLLKKIGIINKNTKVIISIRNDPNQIYNSKIKKLIMKIMFNSADGIVFQTEDAKNYIEKYINVKSSIIPNPINDKFIIDKPYDKERNKTIVNVGRLTEQKNQKLLIDAFKEVYNKHKDYVLKIYGVGNLEEELKEYARELKISDVVKFMGTSDKLEKELYKEGIFVLSSDYEGMPNALMEAMALGLPCISTDCPCGGPKFLINNNINGILIPVNDKDKLTQEINKIIEDKNFEKKISNNANKISNDFNQDKINKMWKSFIKEVMNNEY